MSIADTGRFWKILVIPVLQMLEDSRKYWLYQYCRYWKILENTGNTRIADTGRLGTKLRNVLVYCFVFVLFVRLLWEDGQCIGRPGERRLGAGERRRGGRKKREGSSQYSILKLIAIHNLACSYVISAVHNIRGKSPVMSKYFVWSLRVWYILEFPV